MISCTSARRRDLIETSSLHGVDFIEIDPADRRRLFVYLLEKSPGVIAPDVSTIGATLEPEQVSIEGGVRVPEVKPTEVTSDVDDFGIARLVITVEALGDRSTYELVIDDERFDRKLNRGRFSFTATCPSVADCRPHEHVCPEPNDAVPLIDYNAKDYASFRQLLVDHLDRAAPEWGGDDAADFATAIVEVIAYEGDRLSYQQDVVANERTLKTARLRESAARHARLVDYLADDGASARTFLDVAVGNPIAVDSGERAFTRIADPDLHSLAGLDTASADRADAVADEAFTVMPRTQRTPADGVERSWRLDPSLNRIRIDTGGEDKCCLPAGATSAILTGDLTSVLSPGSFLGLREIRGIRDAEGSGGSAREADPDQRVVVRLTGVTGLPPDALAGGMPPSPRTEVTWHSEDKLPRPLCVSDGAIDDPVAEAFGTVVLVEHGRSAQTDIDLPDDFGDGTQQQPIVLRHQLGTDRLLVSRDDRLDEDYEHLPASHHLDQVPLSGLARVELIERAGGSAWTLRRDMLDSQSDDRHFVVELDRARRGWLRFGNATLGARPDERQTSEPGGNIEFRGTYSYGDAPLGNIGRDSIGHLEVAIGSGDVIAVSNPVPAYGGRAPESIDSIKERAPRQLRTTRRAVRTEDYEQFATAAPYIQRARARFEWTGSWSTVAVVADAQGAVELDTDDRKSLAELMEEVRLAGYPVEFDQPEYVPLDVALAICVAADVEPWAVVRAVERRLGPGCDDGGRPSFFHPDRLSFGQAVWLSDVVAAARAVPGVTSVRPTKFKRLFTRRSDLRDGVITISPFEIARADNDHTRPEHGSVQIDLVMS